jgi:hypothetical protein
MLPSPFLVGELRPGRPLNLPGTPRKEDPCPLRYPSAGAGCYSSVA